MLTYGEVLQGMTAQEKDGAASGSPPNSLDEMFPLLAAEWHPTLNGDRVPALVTPGAKLKAEGMRTPRPAARPRSRTAGVTGSSGATPAVGLGLSGRP
jgi:hypothetical protein